MKRPELMSRTDVRRSKAFFVVPFEDALRLAGANGHAVQEGPGRHLERILVVARPVEEDVLPVSRQLDGHVPGVEHGLRLSALVLGQDAPHHDQRAGCRVEILRFVLDQCVSLCVRIVQEDFVLAHPIALALRQEADRHIR